jgi:hypothetical protein
MTNLSTIESTIILYEPFLAQIERYPSSGSESIFQWTIYNQIIIGLRQIDR